MPREVADRLARELAIVLQRPEVREAFGKIAFDPRSSTPDELTALLRFQMEVWRRTAEAVGVKPE
jgi:tripartite-type tricarboxylate transporter receptor subunit TctC